MEVWREKRLCEVADVQTGPFGSQLKNEQYIFDGTPIVTVEHIRNFRIKEFNYPSVTEHDKQRLQRYILNEGDIVFSRVGSVDLSAYVTKYQHGWLFSSRMLRVRANNTLNKRFLSYYFQQKKVREYILNISVGATMPSINTEILENISVCFPESIQTQQAIAAILSSLDDKIDLLHRQNKTLEELAQTLFRQWFVEETGKNSGVLGDIIELLYGRALKEEARSSSGFPVFGSSGIVGYHSEPLVKGPGIVIGRKGTLGNVFYVPRDFYPIDTTYYILPKRKNTSMYYEYFLLNSLSFENSDSAVPGLNREIALSHEIILPEESVVRNFELTCHALFNKIHANMRKIETLTKLRDTLLPKLMSGEVRVEV